MPKHGCILSAATSLLFAVTLHPQDKPVPAQGSGTGQASGTVVSEVRTGLVGGVVGGFIGPGFVGDVRGLPFSADVIDEREQFLADGNRIHHETHGKIFRDSQGRTRTESVIGAAAGSKGFGLIQIVDPVEKVFITLSVEQKTAQVHHFGGITPPSREANVSPRANPGPSAPGGGLIGGLPAVASGDRQIKSAREDLGTMEIDGFTAHGTRVIFTIPAGQMGNDKPMTNSNERWFSDDLKVELLMKTESPQSGKHTHKLVNIRSGDPDPLLFQVPPDYTVTEQPQR
jgi:hypothetical protein